LLSIGFGVYALWERYKISGSAGPLLIASCLLAAPVLMASQNWDDHDRSENTLQLQWQKPI
jgi:hypothetical protein